jgi:hypothetical protein
MMPGTSIASAPTEGVVKAMLLSKMKIRMATLLVLVTLDYGAGALSRPAFGQAQTEPRTSGVKQNRDAAPPPVKTEKRRSVFSLTAVDLANNHVRGLELPGPIDDEDLPSARVGPRGFGGDFFGPMRFGGDFWELSVGPTTRIMIDGKLARLDALQKVVQGV